MAENKVVNTTQLEADLTSIANAIRAKAESSDSLVFPDGFVSAIANIAGLPSGFSAFASGTFTPTSDISGTQEIEHGLGVAPNFCFLIAVSSMNEDKRLVVSQLLIRKKWIKGSGGTEYSGARFTNWIYSQTEDTASFRGNMNLYQETLSSTGINRMLTDTKIQISGISANSGYLGSGVTYLWVCGVIEGLV